MRTMDTAIRRKNPQKNEHIVMKWISFSSHIQQAMLKNKKIQEVVQVVDRSTALSKCSSES